MNLFRSGNTTGPRLAEAALALLASATVINGRPATAQQKPAGSAIVLAQAHEQMGDDPNLSHDGNEDSRVGLFWGRYGEGGVPLINLPRQLNRSGLASDYYGYFKQGDSTVSVIHDTETGKIYGWERPRGALQGTLKVLYNNGLDIPLDVLQQLDQSMGINSRVTGLIARKAPHRDEPAPVAQPKPNTGGGAMGEMVRGATPDALQRSGLQGRSAVTRGGPAGIMTGTEAQVKDGMLTFTDPSGKRVTMQVRPGGGTGVWLALSADGNDKIINVQPNGNVVAMPLDPALKAQMQGIGRQ